MEKNRDTAAAPHAGAFSLAGCRPHCRTSTRHHTSGTFDGTTGEGLGSRLVAGTNGAVNTTHLVCGYAYIIDVRERLHISRIT
jgi:hypothetical protein